MQKTNISYLTHTWNPIAMRCTRVSEGCRECWHLRTADRLSKNPGLPEDERRALAGAGPFVLRERDLLLPLGAKKPAVIGVQFMGDLFHEDVPDEFIDKAFAVMALSPQHTFPVLTKRPNRMLRYMTISDGQRDSRCGTHRAVTLRALEICCEAMARNPKSTIGSGLIIGENDVITTWPLSNVWLGCTVCNQQEAAEKIPLLVQTPAAHRWISIEPILGPVDVSPYLINEHDGPDPFETQDEFYERVSSRIEAVILGGETGPGARPMSLDWVRSVRDQCQSANVPFFFKSWGKHIPPSQAHNALLGERNLDGKEYNDLPWRTK